MNLNYNFCYLYKPNIWLPYLTKILVTKVNENFNYYSWSGKLVNKLKKWLIKCT